MSEGSERPGENIYRAATSGDPVAKSRAIDALKEAGRSDEEAETLYAATASIAEKAGSVEAFAAVITGEAEVPTDLTSDEVEAFGLGQPPRGGQNLLGNLGISRGVPPAGGLGGAQGGRAASWGRTWEGKDGKGGW